MSTTAVTAESAAPAKLAADQLIEQRIDEARNALWWAELVRESLSTLIVALLAVVLWVIVDQWIYSPNVGFRLLVCAGLAIWCGWQIVTRIVPLLGSSIQPAYAARSLERDMPEMKQALTSYVTLRDDRQQPGLRSRVVRSIGSSVAGRLKTHDALPIEATGTMKWWLVAAALLALVFIYAALSPKSTLVSVGRLVAPLASIEPARRVSISEVRPGDTEAIAGRNVDVSAVVDGLQDDEQVWCRWHTPSGVKDSELRFDQSQLRFAGSIDLEHSASGKVAYYIEAGDAKEGPFWLSVQNVPVVALQSVRYEPPPYTGEVPHTSSSGAITAVDGTKVTIRAGTNRPIDKATIEFNPKLLGDTVRATAGMKSLEIDEFGTGLSITFPLRSARGRSSAVQLESYRIRVWDSAEQMNPDPIVYPIRVIADLPPEVSIVMPRKTPKNLPIDGQQIVEVHAMDPDFGLKQVYLEVRRGIDVVAEPSLWSDREGAKGNRVSEYRFRPAEHELRVGDKVKIMAVATDNRYVVDDPSIEPNTSRTDPIELRIVESQQQLPDQPEGNDGLSKPDDRPANDDKQQKDKSESGSDSGGQGEGQGGSGGSSEKGDGTGQGGKPGENTEPGEKSGEKSGEPGENEQQDGSGTGGQGDANQDSDSSEGSDSTEGGQPNQGDAGSKSGTGNEQSESATGQENTGQENSQNQGDQNQGDQNQGDSTRGDSANKVTDRSDPVGGTGAGSTGEEQTGLEGEGADASGQPEGSQGSGQGGGDQSGADADAPPKHDGEAFERIQDYLEKKKKEQENQNQGQGGQPKDQQGGGQNSERQGSDQPTGGTGESTGTDRDQTGETAENSSQGSKDGDPSGDERGSEQNQTDSGTGDRGNEASDQNQGSKQDRQGTGSNDPRQQQQPTDDSSTGQNHDGSEMDPDTNQSNEGEGTDQGTKDGEQGEPSGDAAGEDTSAGSDRESPTGDQASEGERGANERGDDQQRAGEQSEGQQDSTGSSGEGDDRQQRRRDKQSDGADAAEQKQGKGEQNQGKQGTGEKGSRKFGEDGSESKSQSESENKPDSDPSGPSQPQESGDPTRSDSRPPQGQQQQASGDGAGSNESADVSPPPPPAEPDLEYTKKATDMVLDYLKETRDEPDSDLLKELNWTEEDLQRFADRWQKVKDVENAGPPDAGTNQDVEDALRSLGMRPNAGDAAIQNADAADSLRGIRDSGNRRPPPAAYRDVFDAFRRAVGRQ